jgi:hypothetical protein
MDRIGAKRRLFTEQIPALAHGKATLFTFVANGVAVPKLPRGSP